jgi:4-amino-4-deoxy-L-arabinose transferase-like glycosyltransferase
MKFITKIPLRTVIEAILILIVLGVAVFFRTWKLNSLGFNSDEAVYAGQAAAMVEDPSLSQLFPIFRAHPLLYQSILSMVFKLGINDLSARLVSVAFGVGTVIVAYLLGAYLYGSIAGLSAGLFMAIMPYHLVVSRQVLLDGPMTFFATLTLYAAARFAKEEHPLWLVASGAALGLTFLSKETGIIFLGSLYMFLALAPKIRLRVFELFSTLVCIGLIIAPFPFTSILAGGGGAQKTQQYLVWQLFRRPNHDWNFYFATIPKAIGILLILTAIAGLVWLYKKWDWRETLLISWIIVPLVFFQVWPTKGFQYLLPIAPPFAVLAGRTILELVQRARWTEPNNGWRWAIATPVISAAIVITLVIPAFQRISSSLSTEFLAGSGGVPGGREAGQWINHNIPNGATLMTIGPSMANILQFYSHHKALGLSVSPNPLHRNPSYLPIDNPDFQIRTGEIRYIVWDLYSAGRSAFFAERVLSYAKRYNGRVVHTETISMASKKGQLEEKPVIIIFEVRP